MWGDGPLSKRGIVWTVRVLLAVGVGVTMFPPPQRATADTASEGIRLVSSTSEAIVIEFTLPVYTLREVSAQEQTFIAIAAWGMTPSAEPGAPQLPQIGALIGLPPTGSPSLRILEATQERMSLSHPIYPVPAPVPVRAQTRQPPTPAFRFSMDETLYHRDALYPTHVVDVSEAGWLRDRRLARVMFHPLRYNPIRGELEVTRRLVVEVRFHASQEAAAITNNGQTFSAFEGVLRGALLNHDRAQDWRVAPPVQASATALNTPATQPGSTKITVDTDGLYRLTYADLQAAGLPVDALDPRTFQLFQGGQEIAIHVPGQSDGRFDPDDSLLFYGQAPRSRYTAHNIYWLRYGDAIGLRMASRSVTSGSELPGTAWAAARYAENHFYDSLLPTADGDHWYAADVRPGTSHTASLTLMPPATSAPTATLRLRLVGYTASDTHNPDHRAAFTVNGSQVGEMAWNGTHPVTATVTLNRSILHSGDNSVAVSANVPLEGIWLDTVEVDYPFQAISDDEAVFWGQVGARRYELDGFSTGDISLYDVTDPQHPVRLLETAVTGGSSYTLSFADAPAQPATYLALTESRIQRPVAIVADAPSDLRNDALGADYLIITHADFAAAVQPLAAHRQAQGLQVFVADVQDVYDEFSFGLPHPAAIRDFIAHTLPTYALLVGDGSYDPLDHYGYAPPNYLPPYLATVDPWWGETAADNRYAAVVGDDPLPDVLLGRLPVTTPAEATAVVQKILSYEQTPWLGEWNAHHVFVADDTDDGGDFAASADLIYNLVSDPWSGQRIYLDDLSADAARQETLSAWQRGALLMSFVGHSSWHQWAVEALIDIHDVPDLHNDHRWPVLLAMTCFTGFFHHPEYATLDESLLRLDGGGVVATWSPSGLGVGTGHDHLQQGFYQAVFTDGQTQLGPAILAAKLRLYTHAPAHADQLDTYHLFGDPALALNLTIRPWPYSTFLPLASRNYSGD